MFLRMSLSRHTLLISSALERANEDTSQHLFQECSFTLQLYNTLVTRRTYQGWPHKPTIEITNETKAGKLRKDQNCETLQSSVMLQRRLFSQLRRHLSSSGTSSATASSIPLPLDPDTVFRTLSLYSNDWRRALEFFHWASSSPSHFHHTPSTLSCMIDILGKHLEFNQSRSLISSYASSFSSPSLLPSFRSLFNRLAAAHLITDLLDAFNLASNLGLKDRTTFHLMIDALCDHGHVLDAENLCLRSESPPFPSLFPPDTKTYNMLLRGWLKLRAFGRCRDFWQEMDQAGINKDLHSYSIYMNAISKGGKPWKAMKLFKEMQKKKIQPDVVAYNTAIHAIGHCEGVDFAIRLYQDMVDAGLKPNSATLNTIVKLFCMDGRFKEAYCFVSRMRKKHECEPNVLTYHCFFQYLTRPQEILSLFEQMVQAGCRPRMDTYVMLIKKFGRWGFLRPTFDIWRAMDKHGCSPDAFAYNAFIDALLRKGMVDEARKYDKEMVGKGLSAKPRRDLWTRGLEEEEESNPNGVNLMSGKGCGDIWS